MNPKPPALAVGLAGLLLPVALLAGTAIPAAEAVTPEVGRMAAAGVMPVVLPSGDPAAPTPPGSLTFSPVASARGGTITATFTSGIVKNRPVVLQQSENEKTWKNVSAAKKVKMDAKGKAVFKFSSTPSAKVVYRASAAAYKYKVKGKKKTAAAVVSAPKRLSSDWELKFEDQFSGTKLDNTKWTPTLNGDYGAVGRWCSAPSDGNATVSKGSALLTMSKADSATTKAVDAKTKEKQAADKQKPVGCPKGVFKNARVTTEAGGFRIKTGIVAAELTFPIYQGMHGGFWLQSYSGAELDMIEAFGWKKGITNVIHVKDGRTAMSEEAKWVAKSAVKQSSWWTKSHVFSIEWTRDEIVFRMDGTETKRMKKQNLPDADYFLVMSMLSSDWETGRLTKPVNGGKKAKLPASIKVNWVRAWTKAA